MIKIGDTVVCITDRYTNLHKFDKYTILSIWQTNPNSYDNIHIKVNTKTNRGDVDGNLYNIKNFILLKEYRKIKIQHLCLK